ncbi:hypothetical protein ACEPAI_9264 [Sanghuangporus weigelae]
MAADAPLTILKRSKARTARTRSVTPTDNAPENDEETVAPSSLASKLKKQHKERNRPKARLSFGGDDEEGDGETFQVKKSNLSRKLKLAPSVASSTALFGDLDNTQATPQASSVIYSKEYLSELKASTQSAPSPSRLPDNNAAEPEIILDASEMSGAMIVDDESTAALAAEIPSESSIVAARQRRERLRTTAATDQDDSDFISLTVTRREDLYQGPHPESRLMREDDDLGEGDDEFAEYTAAQERIALGKKSRKKEAANRRVAMQELIEDAEEEDEETAEWEREQLRRGTRQVADLVNGHTAKQEYRPAKIPEPTPLPSLDAAISRLSDSLTQLTLSHTSTTTFMSNLADERVVLEGKEKEMRTMVENAESKRSWFSSFKEWVETVATFLDEKYPRLEELEGEHLSLLRERNDMTTKRRTLDDEDDLDLFLGPLPSKDKKMPEAFDELGRVVPSGTSDATRKERRKARVTRHSHHAHPQEEEGYSTDSSLLPSDEADYQAALTSLRDKVSSILYDVRSDEFRDPSKGVARWFAAWRDKYSDTYSGAFGGLGMVSAWEFWVRLEMLGWDPISESRPLDSFTWFSALYDYSRPVGANGNPEEDGDGEPSLGPDGDLASAMLSTIVPRLCKIMQYGAFDPYSSKHVRAIIDLAEQVEASASREKLELLQKTIHGTFRQAIDDHATLIQPYLEVRGNSRFDPEAIPARQRFLYRRYKLLINFLRWRKYAGEKFGAGEMVSRLVNQHMRPIAETGWEVGGERIMEKSMNVLPPDIRRSLRIDS